MEARDELFHTRGLFPVIFEEVCQLFGFIDSITFIEAGDDEIHASVLADKLGVDGACGLLGLPSGAADYCRSIFLLGGLVNLIQIVTSWL